MQLRIGCRPSRLATTQTDQAGEYICSANGDGTSFVKVIVQTTGDVVKGSLKRHGGKGLFAREVEQALLEDKCNLAVHCLKDMPGNQPLPDGLVFSGYLPREQTHDVFISNFASIEKLPEGAIVGTTSPRRRAQLMRLRPDLRVDEDFRGNIDSRVAKMREGVVDAIILAAAGINRLGLAVPAVPLSRSQFLPAIGQGTLVMQSRTSDDEILRICANATDPHAAFTSQAERSCLRHLHGDCFSPIAGECSRKSDSYTFTAAVYHPTETATATATLESLAGEDPDTFGARMAQRLVADGAAEYIRLAAQ